MEGSCFPVEASFVKGEMILPTFTPTPMGALVVLGLPMRDPPRIVERGDKQQSYKIQLSLFSRVHLE